MGEDTLEGAGTKNTKDTTSKTPIQQRTCLHKQTAEVLWIRRNDCRASCEAKRRAWIASVIAANRW